MLGGLPDDSITRLSTTKNNNLFNNIRVYPSHTEEILSIKTYKKLIITGSRDHNICIFDLDTNNVIHTLIGHNSRVTCLDIIEYENDFRIISGFDDTTLRIWNLTTEICEHILYGHSDNINCITTLYDKMIVSSSFDGTLRIWKYNQSI